MAYMPRSQAAKPQSITECKPDRFTTTLVALTKFELSFIRRLRQWRSDGVKMILIEFTDAGLEWRQVGKAEKAK